MARCGRGILNNEVDAAMPPTISPGERGGSLAARPDVPAGAGFGHGGLGAHTKDQPLLCAPSRPPAARACRRRNPVELPNYPYPIFMVYSSQPAGLVYSPRQVDDRELRRYKDGAPGASGLELKRQILFLALPYHEGRGEGPFKESRRLDRWHEAHNRA